MHDGQLATLRGVLRHYSTLNLDRPYADGDAILQSLRLTPAETRDLLAFPHSPSAPDATRWRAGPLPGCRPSRVAGDLDVR
jgi:cytochrome c peroxidase